MSTSDIPNIEIVLRLLCTLIDVPAAAIVRVSGDSAQFVATHGTELHDLRREHSVFARELSTGETVVINDTAEYEETNGAVGVPGCRFFAGVALQPTASSSSTWMCGFDLAPRELTSTQALSLTDLAALVDERMLRRPRAGRYSVLEQAAAGIIVIDTKREIRYANRYFADLLGWVPSELIGQSIDRHFTPEALAVGLSYTRSVQPGQTYFSSQTEMITRTGERLTVHITAAVSNDHSGRVTGAFAVVNRTAQLTAHVPADERAKFETMVHNSPDVMFVFDRDSSGTYVLKYISAAADQFGWNLDELTSLFDVIHEEDRASALHELGRVFDEESEPSRMHTFRVVAKSGECRYLEARAIDLRSDPNVAGVVVNTRDVTERVLYSDRLAHVARHDHLTQLPNRGFLLDQLSTALARVERRGEQILVCYLDLNGFKAINDEFGHAAGDAVLVAAADRLRTSVRGGDIAGRFGGDEFVVICESIVNEDDAEDFIARLRAVLDLPYATPFGEITCSMTIGYALSQPDDTPEGLLRRADAALYKRKPHRHRS